MRRWTSLSRESRETYWRSLHAMNGTRVVIALVLLLYLTFDRSDHVSGYQLYAETCILYLIAAIGFGTLTYYVRRRFLFQVVVQVLVDIGVISLLYLSAGGARSGLIILYLFPLAGRRSWRRC
jgi:two-component system sensor histidine kinase PilS (NtrC family)